MPASRRSASVRSPVEGPNATKARLPDGDPGDRPVDLGPAAQLPLRPRAARGSATEQGAAALGIRVSRYKLAAFVIAALYLLGGWLPVCAHRRLHQSGSVRAADGRGHVHHALRRWHRHGVLGPAIGAVVASLLPQIVRGTGRFQDIAYALVLLLLLIYVPKGLSALSGIGRPRPAEPSPGADRSEMAAVYRELPKQAAGSSAMALLAVRNLTETIRGIGGQQRHQSGGS